MADKLKAGIVAELNDIDAERERLDSLNNDLKIHLDALDSLLTELLENPAEITERWNAASLQARDYGKLGLLKRKKVDHVEK